MRTIEIAENRHGFYDILVNGEMAYEMLANDEIIDCVKEVIDNEK